jgi:hypothetical protein
MDVPVEEPQPALRLTPGGMAVFVAAKLGRLLLVQFAVALLAGGCIGWVLRTAWVPVITQSISRLPPQGEIRRGVLSLADEAPQLLAQNRFLGFGVELDQRGRVGSTAHLYIEFGRRTVRFFSILGFAEVAYPQAQTLPFNRIALEPGWGAWKPAIGAVLVLGTLLSLMLAWALLATLYMVPVWLVGFYANRNLGLWGSWRMAGVALLPGALLLITSIVCYGAGWFRLPELGAAFVIHFMLGWACALAAPFFVEKIPGAQRRYRNPFGRKVGK